MFIAVVCAVGFGMVLEAALATKGIGAGALMKRIRGGK